MTRVITWRATLAAMCLLPGGALMADEGPQRQLGAHQHGHGRLGIAIEGNKVELELTVPGMDIVGFEHEASTPEQKAAVEAARAKLVNVSTIVRLPEAAGCRQVGGEVDMEGGHDDHGQGKEDGHEEGQQAAGHKEGEHEGHSEVKAEYALECATPGALTVLSFEYFKAFQGARELDVEVITAKGASKFEVTREKPDLDLAGLM